MWQDGSWACGGTKVHINVFITTTYIVKAEIEIWGYFTGAQTLFIAYKGSDVPESGRFQKSEVL